MVSGGNLCLKGQIFLCLHPISPFFSTALTQRIISRAISLFSAAFNPEVYPEDHQRDYPKDNAGLSRR